VLHNDQAVSPQRLGTILSDRGREWDQPAARGASPPLADLAQCQHRTERNGLPGYRLHPLSGDRKGEWAVAVSGNWRLVFEFEGEDVIGVDLVDYH
jgi:plasmid maintenance system killer protein